MRTLRIVSLIVAIAARPPISSAQVPVSQRESALGEALTRYQQLVRAGGWPVVPRGPGLEPGARDPRVLLLRSRLVLEGYQSSITVRDSNQYDGGLEVQIRRFQSLHGLDDDGIVGPGTLRALNVTARARASQIEANLGARRALHPSIVDRFVLVNIAAFALDLVERDTVRLNLRAIVGRPDWPTPTLSATITDVVFGPRWRVPTSIATQEILPTARRDPTYFARTSTRVLQDSAGRTIAVDPATIDWARVPIAKFPYRLVQDPGPLNPLGGVKLVLQSPYDVYLHDTPTPRMFAHRRRDQSHGCVRVENVTELVARLLPAWPIDSITKAMSIPRERRVRLPAPVPVFLVYWTAWPEPDGLVAFRDDVYGLDARGR